MTHRFISVAAACAVALTFSGMAAEREKEKAAVAAAEKWLVLVDGGKYEESWKEAAAYFKTRQARAMGTTGNCERENLGKLISRKVKTSTYKTALQGRLMGNMWSSPSRPSSRIKSLPLKP